jgi:hypothetical protein
VLIHDHQAIHALRQDVGVVDLPDGAPGLSENSLRRFTQSQRQWLWPEQRQRPICRAHLSCQWNPQQRLFDNLRDRAIDRALLVEPHFGFARVDVRIYQARVNSMLTDRRGGAG